MYKSGKPVGFWSAVLLGVGAMVGAGVFALLGQAGSVAGGAVWISFLYAGVVAALSGYSFGRLGARFPSAGGLVEYLVRGYGGGYFSGIVSFLLYFSGLLALALIAKAFGSYGCALLVGSTVSWVVEGLALAVVAIFAWVNLNGARELATVENVLVVGKVLVLGAFILIGGVYTDPARLAVAGYPDQLHVAGSVAFTFFAYEGFRVITNAAEDMQDPARQLPGAILTAISLVALLYVLMSLVVFGNLDVQDVIAAKDYALAQAAAPLFGAAGFVVVSVLAMVSTASAINANLYAVTNVTYEMATAGELPAVFGRPVAHSREGLIISSAIVSALVVGLDLSSLAVIGAMTMLCVHVAVHIGHLRIVRQTGASRSILVLAITANLAVVVAVAVFELTQSPSSPLLYHLVAVIIVAIALEVGFRLVRGRHIHSRGGSPARSPKPAP